MPETKNVSGEYRIKVNGSSIILIDSSGANGTWGATTPAAGTFTVFTSNGIDDNAASTAITIDGSGFVGVANATPSALNSSARDLVVGNGVGPRGITIFAANDSASAIHFADGTGGTAPFVGALSYLHSSDAMRVFAGGVEQARVASTASAVNYFQLTGGATGSPGVVTGSAQGTDSNIDIALTPKGSGVLKFGTHSAIAAESVTGYITIKDAGGTSRKIAVVS